MLLERLTDYFGLPGTEEAEYIAKHISGYDEPEQNQLFLKITEQRSKRFGFPDIATLAKAFADIPPTGCVKGMSFVWVKCDKCHAEYAANLIKCPVCFLRGEKQEGLRIYVKSKTPPHANVIRYNKGAVNCGDEQSCYTCKSREHSFCRNFGNPRCDCDKAISECPCMRCCQAHKSFNKSLIENPDKAKAMANAIGSA